MTNDYWAKIKGYKTFVHFAESNEYPLKETLDIFRNRAFSVIQKEVADSDTPAVTSELEYLANLEFIVVERMILKEQITQGQAPLQFIPYNWLTADEKSYLADIDDEFNRGVGY